MAETFEAYRTRVLSYLGEDGDRRDVFHFSAMEIKSTPHLSPVLPAVLPVSPQRSYPLEEFDHCRVPHLSRSLRKVGSHYSKRLGILTSVACR